MTAAASTDATQLMAQHLSTLRTYATRVVLNGESLAAHEEEDRSSRMRESLGIAGSYRCTEREMVGLLYRGLFSQTAALLR